MKITPPSQKISSCAIGTTGQCRYLESREIPDDVYTALSKCMVIVGKPSLLRLCTVQGKVFSANEAVAGVGDGFIVSVEFTAAIPKFSVLTNGTCTFLAGHKVGSKTTFKFPLWDTPASPAAISLDKAMENACQPYIKGPVSHKPVCKEPDPNPKITSDDIPGTTEGWLPPRMYWFILTGWLILLCLPMGSLFGRYAIPKKQRKPSSEALKIIPLMRKVIDDIPDGPAPADKLNERGGPRPKPTPRPPGAGPNPSAESSNALSAQNGGAAGASTAPAPASTAPAKPSPAPAPAK